MSLKPTRLLVAIVLFVGAFHGTASAQATAALNWNRLLLDSIKRDFARPPVHARNLFHHSAGMWDAWRAFDGTGAACFVDDHGEPVGTSLYVAREQAISVVSYRILCARFATSPGYAVMKPQYDALLAQYGVVPTDTHTVGLDPVAVGNRIAAAMLATLVNDGSNEANNFANRVYVSVNAPMIVSLGGNPDMQFPNQWQPLALTSFVDQQGNVIPGGFPAFQSPEWGGVTPFGMLTSDRTYRPRNGVSWPIWLDPGAPPQYMGTGTDNATFRKGMEIVLRWSAHLDPADGVMWDVSPGTMGDSPEPAVPSDWPSYYDAASGRPLGVGHAVNPATGLPYPANVVPRGDFTRALAEFWADGPSSETPPGHWFALLNDVRARSSDRRIGGRGAQLDPLEWDVKAYLLLGGAMHDAAVSAWSVKGAYDATRPVNSVRYMTHRGQSSNPELGSFSPLGIELVTGEVELISTASSAPGERHAHLSSFVGQIAVRTWRGPPAIANPATDVAGVGWIRGRHWYPYQRPTFVTPPFAGYVSGHSTYSRAAAETLTTLTGDAFFPGGVGEYLCVRNQFLVFEEGPSVDVRLQWATYRDAAEQSGLSRIWGGIHPPFDDMPGRAIGKQVAQRAWARAREIWNIPASCDADLDGSGITGGEDLGVMLAAWGPVLDHPAADLNGDGLVDGADLGLMLSAWGPCIH
jgi:hypothetical protein